MGNWNLADNFTFARQPGLEISAARELLDSNGSPSQKDIHVWALKLWQNYDFPEHSQFIVQHAYVVINAGLGERHAEAGRTQRRLWQTSAILRWLGNEPRVYDIGSRADESVTGAVSIDRDVGRGRN